MSEAPVRLGDILAGKYRVERILGAGNMGVVVAATHVELGKRVALKFMLPGKAEGHEQRERFLREARSAVRLKSRHVARVLDVGTLENNAPYIVMEFLEGQDLSALLKARGPLPFEEAALYLLQTCEAAGEAHAAGIVHRDLKPANLFRTEEIEGSACIKVLDFGISKLAGVDLTLTNEGEMLGSPLYMSPEQINSSHGVDARSDLWSLGVVLYQLVAGRTPFHAETIAHLYSRVLMGDPTPLRAYRNDAPPGFEAVLLRCLERDREQRWPDVAAFAAALAPYAPEHARVYAGRTARAMGLKGAPAASAPELPAAQQASEAALASGGAAQTDEASTLLQPRVALPVRRPPGFTPVLRTVPLGRVDAGSPPRSARPLSVSAFLRSRFGSDMASTLSSSKTIRRAARPAIARGQTVSPRVIAYAVAALGAVLGFVVVGVVGLWVAQRPSPEPASVITVASIDPASIDPASTTAPSAPAATAPREPRAVEPASAPAASTTALAGSAPPASNASAMTAAPEAAKPALLLSTALIRDNPYNAVAPEAAKPALPEAPSANGTRGGATTTPAAPSATSTAGPLPPEKRYVPSGL